MIHSPEDRLHSLHNAAFGDRADFLIRYALVISIASVIAVATQEFTLFLWILVHQLCLATLFVISKERPEKRVSLAHLRLGQVLYVLCFLAWFSGPAYGIFLGDPIYLFAAMAALLGTALYMLSSAGPRQVDSWLDLLVFGIGCGMFAIAVQPHLETLFERAMSVAMMAAATFYYAKTAYVRSQHQAAQRAAEIRYAQALKSRALGQFVGGVAHDFNNLLAVIIGNLELYDLLEDPGERREALDSSRAAAQRAALTVQQLVASSGRTRLTPMDTDLNEFAHELRPTLIDLLEEGMTVEVRSNAASAPAFVDRDMLRTCVIQLCLNAQDALFGKGTVTLHLSQTHERPPSHPPLEADPPYSVIMVEDSGKGVPDEALSMLAEPFYSTKAVGDGSGLGLSAVDGFARQSGGGLHVENGPNGLRAYIYLPSSARDA